MSSSDIRSYIVDLEQKLDDRMKALASVRKDGDIAESIVRRFLSGVVSLIRLQSERLKKLRGEMDESTIAFTEFGRIDNLVNDYTTASRSLLRSLKVNLQFSDMMRTSQALAVQPSPKKSFNALESIAGRASLRLKPGQKGSGNMMSGLAALSNKIANKDTNQMLRLTSPQLSATSD